MIDVGYFRQTLNFQDTSVEKEESFGRFGQRWRLDDNVGAVPQFLLKLFGATSRCERTIFTGAPRLVTRAVTPLDDAIFTVNFIFDGQLDGDVVV